MLRMNCQQSVIPRPDKRDEALLRRGEWFGRPSVEARGGRGAVMRKFLTILSAALLGLAFIAPPASAAPSTDGRVSVRASVSRDCVATVRASWAKFDPPNTIYIYVGSYEPAVYLEDPEWNAGDLIRGSATRTFYGTPQATSIETFFGAHLNGEPVTKEVTKNLYCGSWRLTQ